MWNTAAVSTRHTANMQANHNGVLVSPERSCRVLFVKQHARRKQEGAEQEQVTWFASRV